VSDPQAQVDADIPLARAGSADALGRALEHFRDYLLAIANRQLDPALRAKGGASDIVQETFLEAQRDFAQFTGSTAVELKAWLARLMMNNAANFARHYKATDKRQVAREVGLPAPTPTVPEGSSLPGRAETPSVEMMAGEQTEALQKAIARLPEDYRQVITWRIQEDREFAEIAQMMGRSENAVRKLWFRAIEQLQQEMDSLP
jgi:RNA polymerase sigma-70 factor (ECF subfamily)